MSTILDVERELTEMSLGQALGHAGKTSVSLMGYGSDFGDKEAYIVRAGMHKAGSEERKGLADGVRHLAKHLPRLLSKHFKQEKHHVMHAVGGLKELAHGRRPNAEQMKGLHNVGMKALWSVGAAATAGLAGGAALAAGAFGGELVKVSLFDYAAKAGTGIVKAALHHENISPEDYELLRDFLEGLAHHTENHHISDKRALELLRSHFKGVSDVR